MRLYSCDEIPKSVQSSDSGSWAKICRLGVLWASGDRTDQSFAASLECSFVRRWWCSVGRRIIQCIVALCLLAAGDSTENIFACLSTLFTDSENCTNCHCNVKICTTPKQSSYSPNLSQNRIAREVRLETGQGQSEPRFRKADNRLFIMDSVELAIRETAESVFKEILPWKHKHS